MSKTLNAMFIESARANGDKPAFMQKEGGSWRKLSFRDSLARVEAIGAGLLALGIEPGARVSILANSRTEWSLADYAILGAACTTVPIYQTNPPADCRYIIEDSDAVAIFVEDAEQLGKVREVRDDLPKLRHVIVFDTEGVKLSADAGELSLTDLEERGREAGAEGWHAAGEKVEADDLATLIYTSGTTGPPKGCILSHKNYVTMTEQGVDEAVQLFQEGDRVVLFLPLAHTFARLAQFCCTRAGLELAFTGIATLMDDLQDIQPTLLPSVPRVFEKAYTRILGQFNEATGAKKALIERAMQVGARRGKYLSRGRRVPLWIAAQHAFFHKLVFSKIHARFGGNLRLCVSGGAPLSREVAEFFLACGIVICEGYGLTESTTAMSVNRPDDFRMGTVGKVFPGTEVKIADDGEILVKGDIVFGGYHGKPEATAEVLDKDGWLHTGDIGELDREGFLRITDRKKDLIVTAGGKNVAPQNIENALKSTQYVSQALAFGDRKPYITALITLDPDEMAAYAEANDLPQDMFELVDRPEVLELAKETVRGVNEQLGRVEQVKRFRILPIEFSQETGELTPTLKLKRKVAVERYGEWIEEMYEKDAADAAAVTDRRIGRLQDTPRPTTA